MPKFNNRHNYKKEGKNSMFEFTEKLPALVREFAAFKLTIEGKSRLSVREYCYDIQTFLRYLKKKGGDKSEWYSLDISGFTASDFGKLSAPDFYAYMMFLSENLHNSAKTRARKLTALNTFYTYLVENKKVLSEHPVRGIEGPAIPKQMPKFLELSECKQLLSSVDSQMKERDYLIIVILLNCGLRVRELQGLKLQDIKQDRFVVMGKGGKERVLFINGAVRNALDGYLRTRGRYVSEKVKTDALLLSYCGNPLTVSGIQWIVRAQMKNAGLNEHYSPHKLRHTAATLMYGYARVDLMTLQRVLGHKRFWTTLIYVHSSNELIRDAMERHPLADFAMG
jgi:site-specific recombinase XerD